MPRKMPILVGESLIKSKQSALMAVEIFNKPTAEFRVQTFIMLMHTAWNSFFLSYFHNEGIRPFYKEDNNYFYVRVNGEKKSWDLTKSIKEYWKAETTPTRKNLEFFIGLRNKIEHYRDQSALLELTFGECQSLVSNYENIITEYYGKEHSLADKLSLSIQLSRFKDETRDNAILDAMDNSTAKITDYIKDFRSSLSDDIFSDMNFSHKLFLLPKTSNHQSKDSIAIEWVDINSLTTDEIKEIEKISAIIKQKHIPVKNPGTLKPSEVCNRIKEELNIEVFSPSWHHVRCWKYFEVRPNNDNSNPADCKTNYCQYDEVHEDYVYTEAWVERLVEELSDENTYEEVMQTA
ncbi:MAG: DUF3644 domain-containing protein [Halanaerobiales bacterium]